MAWLEIVKNSITTKEILDYYIGNNGSHFYSRDRYICPFHGDKNPSMSIDSKTGKFKCFGCGASGDGIDFVMQYHKVNQYDALKILSADFHIDIENYTKDSEDKIKKLKLERERKAKKIEREKLIYKYLSTQIKYALAVLSDIYFNNAPKAGESMDMFTLESLRVDKCMWASYQIQYCVWLLNCVSESSYCCDKDYPSFCFDLYLAKKLPIEFESGLGDSDKLKKRLKDRYCSIYNLLIQNSIGFFADRVY